MQSWQGKLVRLTEPIGQVVLETDVGDYVLLNVTNPALQTWIEEGVEVCVQGTLLPYRGRYMHEIDVSCIGPSKS